MTGVDWKRCTWKRRTNLQVMKLQDMKLQDRKLQDMKMTDGVGELLKSSTFFCIVVTGYREGMVNLLNLFSLKVNVCHFWASFMSCSFMFCYFMFCSFVSCHLDHHYHAVQIGLSISCLSFSHPAISVPPMTGITHYSHILHLNVLFRKLLVTRFC